jgi:hypothetical protein
MAYEMNAEGVNGVASITIISTDPGWNVLSGSLMVLMDATGGLGPLPPVAVSALQCNGFGNAPAVMGNGNNAAGVVGVTAFTPPPPSLPPLSPPPGTGTNAGVFGTALNQTATGVLGAAGSIADPTMPAGAGVVGLGGNTPMPTGDIANGAGVVGVGAPELRRGGVFGSIGFVAQLRLIPGPPKGDNPMLPVRGEVGDLYITTTPAPLGADLPGLPVMFMCVAASTKSDPAMRVPFVVGTEQQGGKTPHAA